jgi:adenylosuccinate lyase
MKDFAQIKVQNTEAAAVRAALEDLHFIPGESYQVLEKHVSPDSKHRIIVKIPNKYTKTFHDLIPLIASLAKQAKSEGSVKVCTELHLDATKQWHLYLKGRN